MQMQYLGRSGISVSRLCMGAMSFGSIGNADHEDCHAIIDRALEAGINFIDTADVYSRGESEEIVGKAITGRRDDVVLATKFGNAMSRDPHHRGASRRWIMKACEDSLRRLGTDYIDLYQVHRLDEATDLDETLGALSDLVRAGKVRAVGTSTFPAEAMVEAQWVAADRGHVKPRCEQPPYSIFVRGAERDVFPTCERYGLGAIVWSPLNGGWLTGKYRRDAPGGEGTRFRRLRGGSWSMDSDGADRKLALLDRLDDVAAMAGMNLIALSLAFTLAHPAVTSTIIGPRTMEQLKSQLAVVGARVSDEILDLIDEMVAPGETIAPADVAFEPRALRDKHLRRSVVGA
ncbi:aldo/keto reductase [Rhodococcus wratislaviensis]|uniref:Putative aldo/keto reductase n=1 Tax=Rhodococcus wratislaviensis NBRC 100605 TaxID=1219028 RepID=X0PZ80_RHOWR|nr:aldo/keto reductase [Rhodococcus wratislaviensis]GAF48878.1 putative aldo/keto reductase [Rhodococcus wratislaviensis NBRC 100605]